MSATAGDEEKSVDRHIRVSALVAAGETLTNEDAAWLVRVVEQARGLFTEKNRTIRHLRADVEAKQERILALNEEIETLTADLESVRSTVTASIAERARLETELDSMRARPAVNLHELREQVNTAAWDGGTTCPVCDQRVQVYKRTINKGMVLALLTMYRSAGLEFAHKPTVLRGIGSNARDESLLRYWGLIEELEETREDTGRAGWWRVTPRGRDFLSGLLSVQKYARVAAGELLAMEGEQIDVNDAWRAPFNLAELMAS